ncbi:MAG TPA: DUF721 domain-containing protein [Polyangia bacterium]
MPPDRPFGGGDRGKRPPGAPPYRRRPRRKASEPETVASLLPAAIARLGGEDRAVEQRIAVVWNDAVGAHLAKNTRVEGVRGRTLLVRVTSSSYAHELVLLRREIIARLTLALGVSLVDDIRSRVGPLD